MSAVNTVLDYLVALIKNHASTANLFKDVTRSEFPLCEDFPSCNVNASGTTDDTSIYGMGTRQRVVQCRVYCTLNSGEVDNLDGDIWDVADAVRAAIESDKFLGAVNVSALLLEPIIEINVRSVPSPMGISYLGCKVLEFNAKTREFIV